MNQLKTKLTVEVMPGSTAGHTAPLLEAGQFCSYK
jgi:hypothetical protein